MEQMPTNTFEPTTQNKHLGDIKRIIFCLIMVASSITPMSLWAQTIHFSCYKIPFELDTDKSTISSPYLDNEDIIWKYDGEWLRWTLMTDGSAYGVNAKNGYFISNGPAEDANCSIENINDLRQLPLSDGSHLRAAFIEISEDGRKAIQRMLAALGHYESSIDGLWGARTEAAVLHGIKDLENTLGGEYDISSTSGARDTLANFLDGTFELYVIGEGDECDGCDIAVSAGQLRSHLEIFNSLNPQCNALPQSSLIGARAEPWSGSSDGRQIMGMLDATFDRFSNNDEVIFQQYLDTATQNPNFAPLQWTIGYGYWKRNDFDNAVTWLSKASAQGEPNSAYLLSTLALNVVSDQDSLKLDSSFPNGPLDLQLAVECLTVSAETNETLIVSGRQHQTYFASSAAAVLASLYLHEGSFLYPEAIAAQIDWSNVPKSPELALQMLQIYRQQPTIRRDVDYENEIEALANEMIAAKQEEEAHERRTSQVLSSEEFERTVELCDGYVTLKDVCWAQSREEMVGVLTTKGYDCKVDEGAPGRRMPNAECKDGDAVLFVTDVEITFSCHNFNVCGYDQSEIAELLVANSVIDNLEYKYLPRGNGLSQTPTQEYCGRGKAGSKLCVRTWILGSIVVTLEPGTTKSDPVTFD